MDKTRVWWDGNEVVFVRWTDRSLVFSWCDATETAIQMPRGAVVRLLEKGVLKVEGVIPDWMVQAQHARHQAAGLTPVQLSRHVMGDTLMAAPAALSTLPSTGRVVPETPPAEPSSKFSAIVRIIRKLGGGGDRRTPANNSSLAAANVNQAPR